MRSTKVKHKLLRELSDDEDEPGTSQTGSILPGDPTRPWMPDFRAYLDTNEHVPDDWTTIMWWGVSKVIYYAGLSLS